MIGLDYLHRICKVIHTDLKPENVNLCLTEQEVKEIETKGQLKSMRQAGQEQDTEERVKLTPGAEKDANEGNASTSLRGRGKRESNDKDEDDK